MKLLLDSHTVIWSMDSPSKLCAAAVAAMQDPANQRFVSIGSIWELSIKVRLGKLSLSLPFQDWITQALAALSADLLAISVEDADRQLQLPLHHRDPFDRMLAAQSLVGELSVVSTDDIFDVYGVPRLW